MYEDHLKLIGKRVVDFLFSVNWTFLLGATAKALRAIIDWKSAISRQRGQFEVQPSTNHLSSQKTRLNDLS